MSTLPRLALVIDLSLAILLSLTWLTILLRQLAARHWKKTYSQAPEYSDETTRTIGILQQIQRLMTVNPYATLAEVQNVLTEALNVLAELQQSYGQSTELEKVIQQLVGQQLRLQVQRRKARQHQPEELEAVA